MKFTFTLALLLFCLVVCFPTISNAVTYEEIDAAYKSMTEAQFSLYKKGIIGASVTWKGVVKDVGTDNRVMMRMDKSSDHGVVFTVPQSVALSLRKNETYTFEGTIAVIIDFLGKTIVHLENVSIH